MRSLVSACLLAWFLAGSAGISSAAEDELRASALNESPAESVAAEIRARLAPEGVQVFRGGQSLCKVWFVKELPTEAAFESSETVKYPFAVGELVGVLRLDSKGEDFRGQEIGRGWYTLRYAWQPVDGNHVGTSPTRDFLLLSPAQSDTSADKAAEEQLFELSKEAAESSHPAMLSLLPVESAAEAEPSVEHEDQRDLWILRTSVTGPQEQKIPLRLVVAGHVEG